MKIQPWETLSTHSEESEIYKGIKYAWNYLVTEMGRMCERLGDELDDKRNLL